jgi:ABC-type Fe3+ transport system substrate-binding protein
VAVKRGRTQSLGWIIHLAFLLGLLVLPFALRQEPVAEQARLSGPTEKLVVLSSHWEGARFELNRGFSRWMARRHGRSVRIEWLDVGGTADMVKFIQSEFARNPSGIGVDVVFGGGVEAHMHLAKRGFLDSIELEGAVVEGVPEHLAGMRLRDAKNRWFGAALSGFGIVYNRPVLQRLGLPVPRTWQDLAKPEMQTWVGSGDPRSSGSTHMVYEIILQAHGWKKGFSVVVRLGANVRAFSRSSADVPRDTALGEVACGMALDSYAWSQMEQVGRDRLGYSLPDQLTVINPDSIAVLKGAAHRDLAVRLVEFVLSPEGQALWMLPVGARVEAGRPGEGGAASRTLAGPLRFPLTRMSVRPALYDLLGSRSAVTIDPFDRQVGVGSNGTFVYDEKKASRRWEVINTLLGAALIDNHERLARAWRKLVDAGLPRSELRLLTRPPLSEQKLMSLASEWSEDPALRSRSRVRWIKTFRSRYERIIERLSGSARFGCGCRGVGSR